MSNPAEKPNSPAKPDTAWYDRTGDNHPAQLEPCTECHAHPGAPCVSVVPAFGHGATGTPIRGLHAARVLRAENARAVVGCAPVAVDGPDFYGLGVAS